MKTDRGYRLVRLADGEHAVFSEDYGEKMHPGPGPVREAEKVHIGQLRLQDRLQHGTGEFVVWDVGLGAAANALTLLRMTRNFSRPVLLVSFDHTLAALSFALHHADDLGYLCEYETAVKTVLKQHHAEFKDGERVVNWVLHLADFPGLLMQREAASIPAPHAVMFDPFSPARNPAMWTLPVLENLFRFLDPSRACALTTYSRSTIVRVTLLLAGFFVGIGRPTGLKEETTVAANTLDLLEAPLNHAWLSRARHSSSAEPLSDSAYRQSPLSANTWERLRSHGQFTRITASAVSPRRRSRA